MTAQLSSTPVQKFFDNNGNPLFRGTLTTYAAGTTTPQATYVDSTQTTQNTNPIVLNFRGECNLWLDPTLSYKFVLKDFFGNTIWTVDNIAGGSIPALISQNLIPNPTNTFTLGNSTHSWAQLYLGANAVPALDTASGIVSYYPRTSLETSSSVTPVNFSFPPYTLPRYMSASQLSDWLAGTSAVDQGSAFSTLFSLVGANVVIPPGTFKIGQNLTPRCAMITGAGSIPLTGSVLKPTVAVTKLFQFDSATGNYPEYIGHMAIDGTATTNAVCMQFGGSSSGVHMDIANIEIGNFTGSSGIGIKVVDTIQTWFRHCYIFGCGTNLSMQGDTSFPTSTKFTQCYFTNSTAGQGAAVLTGLDTVFDHCVFESNFAEGCKVIPGASAVCRNIVFNQCWFENNGAAYHLVVDGSAASSIAQVRLNECYFAVTNPPLAVNVTGSNADVLIRAPVVTSTFANNIIFQSSGFGRIDQWDNFWSYDSNVTDSAGKVMGWEGPLTTYSPTITGVGTGGSISGVTVNQARWRRVAVNMLFIEINFTGTVAGTPNYLNVTIPSGFTLKNSFVKYPALVTNNGTEEAGGCLSDGAQGLRFYRINLALYAAGTGGGIIQGLFEVVG